jgi:hypothetical protein
MNWVIVHELDSGVHEPGNSSWTVHEHFQEQKFMNWQLMNSSWTVKFMNFWCLEVHERSWTKKSSWTYFRRGDQYDQQIFIILHEETVSRSCWEPFVVEARIKPSTFTYPARSYAVIAGPQRKQLWIYIDGFEVEHVHCDEIDWDIYGPKRQVWL